MLTSWKSFKRTKAARTTIRKRVALWWLTMSDEEQRDVYKRSVAVSACGLMTCLLLPAMGARYQTQLADMNFRNEAVSLASAETAREALNTSADTAQLLKHPWLHSVEHAIERSPRASLSRYAMYARDEAAVTSVVADRIASAEEAELAIEEHDCLTKAVYYEAGFQKTEGKLAVAEVIMNRVADHRYPNSVCGVVFQGATRTTGCQFTFTCDGALKRRPNEKAYAQAAIVAAHVLMDLHEQRTGSATHYHATYVDPIWNVGLVRTNKIGAHIFYRFPRGAEWAKARNAVAQKRARRARLAAHRERGFGVVPAGEAQLQTVDAVQTVDTSNTVSPAP